MIGPALPWRAAGAMAAVLALGGCGSGAASLSFPPPPPSTATSGTTAPAPADYSRIAQPTVPGAPTTTVPVIGPGGATIAGTVMGPSGPAAGATVQAERIVGRAVATTQATAAADGTFTIPHVLGGIYRVRAWQPPSLDATSPDLFFLDGTQTQTVSLSLQSFAGVQVTSSMAPATVQVGGRAALVVSVTEETVGADGVLHPTPQAGQSVSVDDGGAWTVLGANPAVTNVSGQATFTLTCDSSPAPPLLATVAGAPPATVTTSACVNPAPTTTTTPAPTTTTIPGTSTPTSVTPPTPPTS